jgi:hypothetical protein
MRKIPAHRRFLVEAVGAIDTRWLSGPLDQPTQCLAFGEQAFWKSLRIWNQ